MVARKSKPYLISEKLILPSVKKILDTVLHHEMSSAVIKSIPLSSNMVQRQVDEMATDIKVRQCSIIRNTECSLKLDESTLPRNKALLQGYVHFVYNGVLHE